MKSRAVTASDRTLVSVTEEKLHAEGAMLSLVLTKPNAKWLGALLSPAEAHQLAVALYEWAAEQDAAFPALRRPALVPMGEHQGSRRVNLGDIAAPPFCRALSCRRAARPHSHYCTAHQLLERKVAP